MSNLEIRKKEIKEKLRTYCIRKSNYYPVCIRCYYIFWFECILRGRSKYQIVFSGKHIVSFRKRIMDWISYYIECCKIYYIKNYNLGFKKERKYYELCKENNIEYEAVRPIHIKSSNVPDEFFLYNYLEKCGLKIVDEEMDGIVSVYNVEIIN